MREREASPSLHPTGLSGLMSMGLWMNNLSLQTFQNATKMKISNMRLKKKNRIAADNLRRQKLQISTPLCDANPSP